MSGRSQSRLTVAISPDEVATGTDPRIVGLLFEALDRVLGRETGDHGRADLALAVRTATTALHLTNLAEVISESRRLRASRASRRVLAAVSGRLDGVLAQPVLTAHPTEARRHTVLRRLQQVRAAVTPLLDRTPDAAEARERLDIAVELLWRTDSVRHTALRVVDEIAFAESFLRGALAEAVITVELEAQPLAPATARGVLRLGSWIGGDQDGNPYCTAADLQRALQGAAAIARERHRAFALEAASTLSLPCGFEDLDAATAQWLRVHAPDRIGVLHPGEVLRLCARVIADRLDPRHPAAYVGAEELAADIEMLAREMERRGVPHLVPALLGRWRAWCRVAGLHLLDVDVRTHRSVLRALAAARLGRPVPSTLAAEDLHDRLRAAGPPLGGEATRDQLLDSLRVWQDAARRSSDLRGSLVLSGTEDASDLVTALWLLEAHPPLVERIRISPILEHEASLVRAEEILGEALAVPAYRASLRWHGDVQEVTFGYSDTTKESGYLSGSLALRAAHRRVLRACEAAAVSPLAFHGRGGTVARGGARTAEAVLAQPRGTIRGRLRWTEQGESISLRFDDPAVGANHLAEALAALAETAHGGGDPTEPPAFLVDAAEESRRIYRTWYMDPALAAFHRRFTPIDALERLAIGSRPASRRADPTPQTLRAIPWHFSWSQSRVIASVWYGAGTGLARIVDGGHLDDARALYRSSVWFRSTIDNLEMVAFKTDWEVAEMYADLAPGDGPDGAARWLPALRAEYERCRDSLLAIRGGDDLLDHQPDLRARLAARARALVPLHRLQVTLLAEWRATGDPERLRLVHGTVNGIAAGLQNTG